MSCVQKELISLDFAKNHMLCTCRGREREVPLLAIQTLKKTRLQKCLIGCSVEDIDSCVHVVEVSRHFCRLPLLLAGTHIHVA